VKTPDLPGVRETVERLEHGSPRDPSTTTSCRRPARTPRSPVSMPLTTRHLRSLTFPRPGRDTVSTRATSITILDGPVQADHPELKGKVASAWSLVSGSTTVSGAPDPHATAMAILAAGRIDNDFGAAVRRPAHGSSHWRPPAAGRPLLRRCWREPTERWPWIRSHPVPFEPKVTGRCSTRTGGSQVAKARLDQLQGWRREQMALATSLGDRLVRPGATLVVPAGNRVIPTDAWAWVWADGVLAVAGSDGEGRQAAESSGGALVWLAARAPACRFSAIPRNRLQPNRERHIGSRGAGGRGVPLARDVAPGLRRRGRASFSTRRPAATGRGGSTGVAGAPELARDAKSTCGDP
jgi:subtilisin family serine protease